MIHHFVSDRALQAVQLDKHIKLLDSPGIVMATGNMGESAVLSNCVKVSDVYNGEGGGEPRLHFEKFR